jgi:UDP-N-acetylmuramoyl-L-alanyl-D-glutamate--2,6-diaminopimelate ligase
LKSLIELLTGQTDITVYGNQEIFILDIQQDSRLVKSGSLFVAQKGLLSDGHLFIEQAIENGAVCILCESEPSKKIDGICYVMTTSIKSILPDILNHYFDYPSQKCKLVGITGTNGKTTTATLCYHLFESLGYKSGLLSTVTNRIHDKEIPSTHTTPDIISLYKLLNAMIEEQCSHVFYGSKFTRH